MERIRSLPLMNFPDTGGVADKYGVSRISGAKGTPHPNIEETFRKSGYIKTQGELWHGKETASF